MRDFSFAAVVTAQCISIVFFPGPQSIDRSALCVQETYQVECDIATGDERENACRPLERFENLVRQSGQNLATG